MSETAMPEEAASLDAVIVENGDLLMLLWRLESLKSQKEHIEAELKVVTMAVEAQVAKSALFTDPEGRPARATVVRPAPKVNVNLDLISQMRPELYQTITKTVLDGPALKKAFRAGMVDPEVARAAMWKSDISPSVKITFLDEQTTEETEDQDD